MLPGTQHPTGSLTQLSCAEQIISSRAKTPSAAPALGTIVGKWPL